MLNNPEALFDLNSRIETLLWNEDDDSIMDFKRWLGMDKKDATDPSYSAKKIYKWVDVDQYKDFIKYMIEQDQAKNAPEEDPSVADKKFDKLEKEIEKIFVVKKKRKSVPITKIDPEILDLTISPKKRKTVQVIEEVDITSSEEDGDAADGKIHGCNK